MASSKTKNVNNMTSSKTKNTKNSVNNEVEVKDPGFLTRIFNHKAWEEYQANLTTIKNYSQFISGVSGLISLVDEYSINISQTYEKLSEAIISSEISGNFERIKGYSDDLSLNVEDLNSVVSMAKAKKELLEDRNRDLEGKLYN